MGFNSWPKGTDGWIIKNDSLAYSVVLDLRAPITIGGADVCRAHLKRHAKEASNLMRGHGEVAEWLANLFRQWITSKAEFVARDVGPEQWVIWDTVVVAHLLGYIRSSVYPRPALNTSDLSFVPVTTDRSIRWITSVDEKRMWPVIIAKCGKHRAPLPKACRSAR